MKFDKSATNLLRYTQALVDIQNLVKPLRSNAAPNNYQGVADVLAQLEAAIAEAKPHLIDKKAVFPNTTDPMPIDTKEHSILFFKGLILKLLGAIKNRIASIFFEPEAKASK